MPIFTRSTWTCRRAPYCESQGQEEAALEPSAFAMLAIGDEILAPVEWPPHRRAMDRSWFTSTRRSTPAPCACYTLDWDPIRSRSGWGIGICNKAFDL